MDLSHFREQLKQYHGKTIYVGFSGGADSTALLLLLKTEQQTADFKLHAVHFQHNLRGEESRADAEWCKQLCAVNAIDFTQIDLDVPNEKQSGETTESTARRLRLEHWSSLIEDGEAVALGHHADDRIENVIIRLTRGSNTTGLTSLRATQAISNVIYIRPLLCYSRDEIISFLQRNSINDWRHDSSNDDDSYTRNLLRNEILPTLFNARQFARGGITRSLEVLDHDADFIEQSAVSAYKNSLCGDDLLISAINETHSALIPRILRHWLSTLLKHDFTPGYSLTTRFENECKKCEGTSHSPICLQVTNSQVIYLRNGRASLSQQTTENVGEVSWNWSTEQTIKWGNYLFTASITNEYPEQKKDTEVFELNNLPTNLQLRKWSHGDTMIPVGRTSPVKLKKLFSDKKIYSDQRQTIPLLIAKNEIIWIPTLRRSSQFLTDNSTRKYLTISFVKSE